MLVTFLGCICGILIVDILSVSFSCPRNKIKSEFIARLPDSAFFGFAITMGILVSDMLEKYDYNNIAGILVALSIIVVGKMLLAFASKRIFK